MDRGKPIVVDPNLKQFPYLPVKGQVTTTGHGTTTNKVIVVNSLEDLKHIRAGHNSIINRQSQMTQQTGGHHLAAHTVQGGGQVTQAGHHLAVHTVQGGGQVLQPGHHLAVHTVQGGGQVTQPGHHLAVHTLQGGQVTQAGHHLAVHRVQGGGSVTQAGSQIVNTIQNSQIIQSGLGPTSAHVVQASGDNSQAGLVEQPVEEQEEEVPEVDIAVNNVVCSFSIRCHINLKNVAREGANVIYKRENNVVNMKLRKPYVTANIWSSGKITCTGATSEEDSKIAARRVARILQQLCCQRARFSNFRVVNVLGTCSLPWGIKLNSFATAHPKETCYEPELHPGATYRIKAPKATLKVFSTGSITITAPSVANLQNAVQHIFPIVYPHRLPKAKLNPKEIQRYHGHSNISHHVGTGKDKYSHFRYKKRLDESDDDEDSFGSDSS